MAPTSLVFWQILLPIVDPLGDVLKGDIRVLREVGKDRVILIVPLIFTVLLVSSLIEDTLAHPHGATLFVPDLEVRPSVRPSVDLLQEEAINEDGQREICSSYQRPLKPNLIFASLRRLASPTGVLSVMATSDGSSLVMRPPSATRFFFRNGMRKTRLPMVVADIHFC